MLVYSINSATMDSVHRLCRAKLEDDVTQAVSLIFSKAQFAIVSSRHAVCHTDFSLSQQIFGTGLLTQQLDGVAPSTINSTIGWTLCVVTAHRTLYQCARPSGVTAVSDDLCEGPSSRIESVLTCWSLDP